jgi:hypothetical protein
MVIFTCSDRVQQLSGEGKLGESSKSRVTDDDIEKQLAALKDL